MNMEQSLRKRGFVDQDRISELPEALRLHILSSLPTKDVIVTSVLSKEWRSLWKMVPKLRFISPNQKIAEKVTRSLLLHKSPVLESLRLSLSKDSYIGDIGVWLGIAFARHLRELVIDGELKVHVYLPSSMFCSPSLETLILKNSILVLIDVPSTVSMKSLKTLHLQFVMFKDDESIRNLISGSPNLEDLLVHRCHIIGIKRLIIVAPSLEKLSICDVTMGQNDVGYVINAPSLKYLNIEIYSCEFVRIENSPELVEANIRNVSKIVNETFLRSLKPVRRLSLDLSPLEINCPTSTIFYQLVYLEVQTFHLEWLNLLILMLDSSPKLQVLKIIDCMPQMRKFLCSTSHGILGKIKWSEPENVPECLVSQLETFVWKRYDWTCEEQEEVATYILRNARWLKKVAFSVDRAIVEFNELEERLWMLKELVSNSCHFASRVEQSYM